MKPSKLKVLFLGIVLASGTSVGAHAFCGEATCVPVQGTYISHFTGAGCTGTESYYLPYDNYGYQCRTGDGGGECGTIQRTVTNRSYFYNGRCYDAWPSGNTLSQFVTVYRTPPPPYACGFASPNYGSAPLSVWFNASCSYDPAGGSIINYQWNTGEGYLGGPNAYYTYFTPGTYPVWLTVWDNEGESATTYIGTITVN
jgi:PKD repeat protein